MYYIYSINRWPSFNRKTPFSFKNGGGLILHGESTLGAMGLFLVVVTIEE